MKSKSFFSVLALAACLALGGCANTESGRSSVSDNSQNTSTDNQSSTPDHSTDDTVRSITLCESWGFDSGFYPLLHAGNASNFGISYWGHNFYDTLVKYENGEYKGSIADKWEISEDGKEYTFTLKNGILFSDGTPCNSAAVKKSLDAALVNLGQFNGSYGKLTTLIDTIETPDETTLVLKLSQPYYGTINDLSMCNPLAIVNPNAFNDDLTVKDDLKTMTMNGVYAMSAITALVAQNTTGVKKIVEMTPAFLGQQIDVVFEDIRPDAVKIGMVASCSLIEIIAERLRCHQAKNIVVDPVMVATSGDRLISEEAVDTLKSRLLPLATIVTPNIPEAEILSGIRIRRREDMEAAARNICDDYGCAVLLKGGHSIQDANDFLYGESGGQWFYGTRIDNPNTHGTGCTLSSAIAANLAKGFDLPSSIQRAKDYLSGALGAGLNLGRGRGPMQHNFNLTGQFALEAAEDRFFRR